MKAGYTESYLKFAKMEMELDLFNQTIDGVYFWDRVRTQIYSKIRKQTGEWKVGGTSKSSSEKDSGYLSKGKTAIVESAKILDSSQDCAIIPRQKDILFKASSTKRRHEIDGVYWDRMVDPIADSLSYSAYSLESHSSIQKYCSGDVYTKSIYNYDVIDLLSAIRSELVNYNPIGRDEKPILQQIEKKLREAFDVDIDVVGYVREELKSRHSKKPVIDHFLNRVDPSAVLIGWNPSRSTLIESAQERNIPVIELQHGVDSVNKTEISYPYGVNGTLTFPDIYFSWGYKWAERPDFPIDDVRIVGWPFLDCMKTMRNQRKSTGTKRILIMSQPTNIDMLIDIATTIKNESEFEVTYRLHPKNRANWKSNFPELDNSDIEVDDGNISLYDQFGRVDYQLGTTSTALFEGLQFNLPTLVYETDSYVHELLSDIDIVTSFTSSEDVIRTLTTYDGVIPDCDMDGLFRPNPIDNIERELNDIIG
ncbi:hypothetical protein OB955_19945 [Halobacteria archaeon AArc-m2/3/4]|uniref:CDP-Glycerol:Poly(Glycerophosphate) glycerophosphotransferase n=1 Tax=Natronoglomus mannanivorans TaxID=2979990 RepID=A0ABT2QJD0_9EURY|nr:hypothetical protein [Halobacteria archaeon AArc-m2/3/4]